eukprot:scpid16386/ scgid13072/ 
MNSEPKLLRTLEWLLVLGAMFHCGLADEKQPRSVKSTKPVYRPPLDPSEWGDSTSESDSSTLGCIRIRARKNSKLAAQRKVAILNAAATCSEFNNTLAQVVAQTLQTTGNFLVSSLTGEQLSESSIFSRSTFDVLAITQASCLPVNVSGFISNYIQFLGNGGDLVLLGGKPPFIRTSNVKDMGINVMSEYEPYRYTNTIAKLPAGSLRRLLTMDLDQSLAEKLPDGSSSKWQAELEGYSLSGLSALVWPNPGETTYAPLLSVYDPYGRQKGVAIGQAVHKRGSFKGSTWIVAGVVSPVSFYGLNPVLRILTSALQNETEVVNIKDEECLDEPNLLLDIPSYLKHGEPIVKPLPTLASLSNGTEFLALSKDKRGIVYPNGQQFFMLGADFYRSILGSFNAETLTLDMQKAADAGLNALRMFGYEDALQKQPDILPTIRTVAKDYGLYLLMDMSCKPEKDSEQKTAAGVAASAKRTATLLHNETWLLGYDLCNEPYYWDLGEIMVNATTKLKDLYDYNKQPASEADFIDFLNPGYSSTFPNLHHGLPIPEKYKPVMDDVAGIYSTWLNWRKSAIRSVEQHSLLTVGYNTLYGLMAYNQELDFVSHHAYPNGPGYTFTLQNYTQSLAVPTTMDRLAYVWDNLAAGSSSNDMTRPISYGEYATSNGDILELPDGTEEYVDFQTSALYDMLVWLRMLSQGYSGALRWRVNDKPYILSLQQDTWRGNDSDPMIHKSYIRESRFGLFWYDGSPQGRPKPLAYCTDFLSQYVGSAFASGMKHVSELQAKLNVRPTSTGVHVAYTFTTRNALFVADVAPGFAGDGSKLLFQPVGATAATVMVFWLADQIESGATQTQSTAAKNATAMYLRSSADTNVQMQVSLLTPALHADSVTVAGVHGAYAFDDTWFNITLLAGESVSLTEK